MIIFLLIPLFSLALGRADLITDSADGNSRPTSLVFVELMFKRWNTYLTDTYAILLEKN